MNYTKANDLDMNENTAQDQEKLDLLYRECFTPVFRYLFFRTKDYDVASDLAQASFLKFMKQEKMPEEYEHKRRLLFVIARTGLIDYWRSSSRNKNISMDDIGEISSDEKSGEEIAIQNEDAIFVRSILNDLPELENEIVSMRLSSELSYAYIAETLGITEVNARKIYSRALGKIGQILKTSGRF